MLALLATIATTCLAAATPAPTTFPVFGALGSDVPRDDEARARFQAAASRYGLGPVGVIDAPVPPKPTAPAELAAARTHLEKLRFPEAQAAIDRAIADATATGGAGLTTTELSDLFLLQAIAREHADWRAGDAVNAMPPADPTVHASYLRAAAIAPGRALDARRVPPIAHAHFHAAAAEVKGRGQVTMEVRGPADAQAIVDGGAPTALPAKLAGLAAGEHFVRVEAPGRLPWAAFVPTTEASFVVDVPPLVARSVPDDAAAELARAQGARFALVAELRVGASAPAMTLRLVDAATGARQDTVALPWSDPAALDAAVMRIDERARKAELVGLHATGGPAAEPTFVVAAVPTRDRDAGRARLADDPGRWAREHWPLVTAIGIAVAASLALGIAVASGDRHP